MEKEKWKVDMDPLIHKTGAIPLRMPCFSVKICKISIEGVK